MIFSCGKVYKLYQLELAMAKDKFNLKKPLRNFLDGALFLGLTLFPANVASAQKPEGSRYRGLPCERVDYHVYNSWEDFDKDGKMDPSKGELKGMDKDCYFHEEPLRINFGILGLKPNVLQWKKHVASIRIRGPNDEVVTEISPFLINRVNWAMGLEYRIGTSEILSNHGEGPYIAEFFVDGGRVGYREFKLRLGR